MPLDPNGTSGHGDWGPARTRTVRWHEPGPTTARGLAMAGIDYVRAVVDGVFPTPPMETQLQFDFVDVQPGWVTVTCVPDGSTYNGLGSVHGGLLCTLLDVVTGCALHSTLPRGKGYTSVAINVNYVKPVRADTGILTATGTVVKSGSRVGVTQGVVTDADGKLVATATATLLILDL